MVNDPQTRWHSFLSLWTVASFIFVLVWHDSAGTAIAVPQQQTISYAADVRPILSKKCFACHGPDEHGRGTDLRLDRYEDATDSAIVPGDPEESDLIDRITSDDSDLVMPPKDSGKDPLTKEELKIIQTWIKEGAKYERHWAFRPILRPQTPKLSKNLLPKIPANTFPKFNYIDQFVSRKANEQSLAMNELADRHELARRVALDLTGLPPTKKQLLAFIGDTRKDAYLRYVDQILSSPAFGEHWATLWLDLARYADTDGYADDYPRTIWPYRDWVIRAFNKDMPFDQFTIEQLAGDLLPNPTMDQLVATGFHRNTMTNSEGGTINEEFRVAAVKDRVDTTMLVWNGFTAGCAKCHSHKYDPMSQREYYQLYAILNQTADSDRRGNPPTIPAGRPETNQALKKLIQKLAGKPKEFEAAKKKLKLVNTPIFRELPKKKQRKTHLLIKGNWSSHGETVTAKLPPQFGPSKYQIKSNPSRMDLAKWLIHPDHPLTARVQVNRIWAKLFGRGIVETQEDFGTTASLPTHPELLDALAIRYSKDLKWSLKMLLREIVSSATYRQKSTVTADQIKKDPRNLYLSHSPRFRLTAEQLRDQSLQIGGLLNSKMYGPSVVPRLPVQQIGSAFSNRSMTESKGKEIYRRGLYTYVRRSGPYPATLTFDGGGRQTCLCRRIRTNTPLQALTTLNDDVFFEAAQGLARRVLSKTLNELSADPIFGLKKEPLSKSPLSRDSMQIDWVFFEATCRLPTEKEKTEIQKLLDRLRIRFQKEKASAQKIATQPIGKLPQKMNTAEAATWTVVCNVILNLDEVLTR